MGRPRPQREKGAATGSGLVEACIESVGPRHPWAYPEDGRSDLLVNDIGSYTGQSIMPGGPTVLVVSADGDWSVAMQ